MPITQYDLILATRGAGNENEQSENEQNEQNENEQNETHSTAVKEIRIGAGDLNKATGNKPLPNEPSGWLHFTHAQWSKATKEEKLGSLETLLLESNAHELPNAQARIYEYVCFTMRPDVSIVPINILRTICTEHIRRNREKYNGYVIPNNTKDSIIFFARNGSQIPLDFVLGSFVKRTQSTSTKTYYVQPKQRQSPRIIFNPAASLEERIQALEDLYASQEINDKEVAEFVAISSIKTELLSGVIIRAVFRHFANLNQSLERRLSNTALFSSQSDASRIGVLYTKEDLTQPKHFKLEYGYIRKIDVYGTPTREIESKETFEKFKKQILKK